jgi:hypothetical protein
MVASLRPEPSTHTTQSVAAAGAPGRLAALPSVLTGRAAGRPLSAAQVAAIRSAMRVFLDDDLSRGIESQRRLYCDGCERARPAAGFIQYERYAMCNDCATEYEVARARALLSTQGQFIRDKRFGEGDYYAL